MEATDTYAASPLNHFDRAPWPFRDIVFGVGIPVLYRILTYSVSHLDQIRYRPWLASPLSFALWISFLLSLLIYPIYIFRKRSFGPLIPYISISHVLKELLKSIFILLLISVIIGLILGLLAILLKTEITRPEIWEWATYAPNSIQLIFILVLAFTFGPICEEIFYRGFLYNALKTRSPAVFAVLFQAAFFSLSHRLNLLYSFEIFLVGIALALVYEKRKTLLSPIFIHVMINAVWVIPLLSVGLQNLHTPAADWETAKIQPNWLKSAPPEQIERQKEGMQQWQYAINVWGSKGSRQWKMEANAFNAVCSWFPEDRTACAKAKVGIVTIYLHYLRDYRRAITEAEGLLSLYPEQREQCASAVLKKGWSYYMLRDSRRSREAFNKVVSEFKEYNDSLESARKGITWLDILERK